MKTTKHPSEIVFPAIATLKGAVLYALHFETDGLITSNFPFAEATAADLRNVIANLRLSGWEVPLVFHCKEFEHYRLVRPRLHGERLGDYCLFRAELNKYWSARFSNDWRA